jgi:hypothetical protein
LSRLSRRSRALALAGFSLTVLAASGCAHAGVTVRTPEADNTQLPANGFVRLVYPHTTAHAPAAVPYPQVLEK